MDLRCPFFAFAIGGMGRLEIPDLCLRPGLFPTQCGYFHEVWRDFQIYSRAYQDARTIHGKHSVENAMSREKSTMSTMLKVLVVFLSFRFPFLLVDLMMVQCIEYRTFDSHAARDVALTLTYFSWCVNPLLYAWCVAQFRRAFICVLGIRKMKRRGNNMIYPLTLVPFRSRTEVY